MKSTGHLNENKMSRVQCHCQSHQLTLSQNATENYTLSDSNKKVKMHLNPITSLQTSKISTAQSSL